MHEKEKYNLSQLRTKVDDFIIQKAELLDALRNSITLTYKLIEYQKKLDVNFVVKRIFAYDNSETN